MDNNGFYIGNVYIPGRLVLGPMAGVTDLPFRLLCREAGASYLYTEMISAKGILYNNKNTELLWATDEKDSPLALQLFGSDPDIMSEIAKRIEEKEFDVLDINMGCPVPKVVNNHEGSALMKDISLSYKIVSQIKKSIKKPVTIKMRKGFDKDSINAVEFAKAMEDAGADAVAVHGRTRTEYYSGNADWEIIAEVKRALKIPVIASGDIFKSTDVYDCIKTTGVEAVMAARGARGNPWIFSKASELLSGKVTYDELRKCGDKPNISTIVETIKRHTKMLVDFKGEYTGIREMRKHFSWYLTGLKGSASFRRRINEAETVEDIIILCDELLLEKKSQKE